MSAEALPDKEGIEALKEIYHEAEWGSPLQLSMPDGTSIGRVYGLEEDEALRRYFDENIIGTEGYARYLCTPEQQLYDDGVLDEAGEEVYNDNLYWKWLTETYGKTDRQRFEDWLMTKEGRYTALDAQKLGLEISDYNIEVKSHPTIKGLYQIKYDIPKVNGNTDPITPLYDEMGKVLTKPAGDVKTVYNTAEIGFSDIEIYAMGKQALEAEILAGNIEGYNVLATVNGITFKGYYRNGILTNFYPTFE